MARKSPPTQDTDSWSPPPAGADLAKMDRALAGRFLFQLLLINDFEHAVLQLQDEGCVWGPVHTSVGQEACAVGAIAALRSADRIAGSHRSHHHFLAKVINYVLPQDWNPTQRDPPEEVREVVRRTLAEIMGLAEGYCGGRGGSMHLRHVEAGVIGTNAIVGGGIPIATGAALAEKLRGSENLVLSFFGEGALNQGAFHESANLAGIWNLPIIYFIENNRYAVATCATSAIAGPDLAARAASYGMDAFTVDGTDPAAVYATTAEAACRIRSGGGPCIIEAHCYRRYHHAGRKPGSAFGYRSKEEESRWLCREPVSAFPETVLKAGLLDEAGVEQLRKMAEELVANAVEHCTMPSSPRAVRPELWPKAETVTDGLRSDGKEWRAVRFSEQEDFSDFEEIRFPDAIAAVTGRWLEKDERVFVMGEEVANFGGGAYGATKGLPDRFPDRILNTPISEAGFVGMTCGAALAGMRPIVEIMFGDFALVAADQLFNQIAKTRHMYGGQQDVPLVARTRVATGCGYGGQHSMDPVGLYALFPGWRIAYPSNAFDYVGLFNSAMVSLDPVLMIEHHSLYSRKFRVPLGNLDYLVEMGRARVIESGDDVSLIAYGPSVARCQNVAASLRDRGVSADIIDLRVVDLPSMDLDTIGRSVGKTGAVVIVEEASRSQSIGAAIAGQITERFFDLLDAPVARVTSSDVPNPVSRVLEAAAILNDDEVLAVALAAARRTL